MTDADRQALLDLAARCEAAEGPDRELDAEIAFATGWATHALHKQEWLRPDGVVCGLPEYTASLDAATSLVPEGWCWQLRHDDRPCAQFWQDGDEYCLTALAATPALAQCAAALKARAAQ